MKIRLIYTTSFLLLIAFTAFGQSIGNAVNTWHKSTDNKNRIQFQSNDRTYFGSQNGFEYQNNTNSKIFVVSNDGRLALKSGVWHFSLDGINRFKYVNGRSFFGSQDGYEFRSNTNNNIFQILNDGRLALKTGVWHFSLDGINRFKYVNGRSFFGSQDGYEFRSKANSNIFQIFNDGRLAVKTGVWHFSLDGKKRINFAHNGRTFFGTQNGYEFRNKNDQSLLKILENGNVAIGTLNPGSWKLAVNGKIRAKEVRVETAWADFVFEDDYKLPTLNEVEEYIKTNGHLKDIPSEKEVEENGVLIGEMNAKLLQKIEELTLYLIEQNKVLQSQNLKLELQQEKIEELQKRILD